MHTIYLFNTIVLILMDYSSFKDITNVGGGGAPHAPLPSSPDCFLCYRYTQTESLLEGLSELIQWLKVYIPIVLMSYTYHLFIEAGDILN